MSALSPESELRGASARLARRLAFKDRTMSAVLNLQARLGDKVLIRSGAQSITYEQAPQIAAQRAGTLLQAGVVQHDRVVSFLSNRLEHLELWFGLAWMGGVLVPLNIEYRGEQLRHAVRSTRPKIIVTERALVEHLLRDLNTELLSDTQIFVIDDGTHSVERPAVLPHGVELHPFDTAAGTASKTQPIAPADVQTGDPAALLLTSGTTGASKSVICPHGQFYWWGVLTGEVLGLDSDDVLFTTLPFFHTNALNALWQALLVGATYTFSRRFSASQFWPQVREHGATVTYLLGAMAQILVNREQQSGERDHQLRIALCPATPAETVVQFKSRFGMVLIDGYGSTETNMVMATPAGERSAMSMGRALAEFDVRIVDDNDCDVKPGDAGELIVRNKEAYSMASGYFDNPEATVKAWRNLWFHTGDRVYQSQEHGTYHFVDRMVDAIRRRGENISSWEVERALLEHPDIEQAAVFGVASDLGSEQDVMTHVVAAPGHSIVIPEVIEFLEQQLARFAIPRYWEVVSSMPTTENGKVRKNVLREQGVGPVTWDRDK